MEKTLPRGSEVWALIRCALAAESGGRVKLALFLVNQTEEERIALPLTVVSEKENGNAISYLIRFRVPELAEDEYALVFVAENLVSGESSIIGCEFTTR